MSSRDNLRELLSEGAARLGVDLGATGAMQLLKYLILLQKWNARINLTGTRDDREIVARHLLDSLAVVPHIPADTHRLIDVGSGAGLPGAVVAMFRPGIEVTALEPIRKKHAFLATLRREMPLANFHPVAKRVDDYRASAEFDLFDTAVSRATWSLDEWLEFGSRLIHDRGTVLGMEGADERPLPPGATRHPYDIEDRTRAVVRSPKLGSEPRNASR